MFGKQKKTRPEVTKMKKAALFLVILSCLVITGLFIASAGAETVSGTWGDLNWTIDDSGTLFITGSGVMNDYPLPLRADGSLTEAALPPR